MHHKWKIVKGHLSSMDTVCVKPGCFAVDTIGADFCDSRMILKEMERIGKRNDCKIKEEKRDR